MMQLGAHVCHQAYTQSLCHSLWSCKLCNVLQSNSLCPAGRCFPYVDWLAPRGLAGRSGWYAAGGWQLVCTAGGGAWRPTEGSAGEIATSGSAKSSLCLAGNCSRCLETLSMGCNFVWPGCSLKLTLLLVLVVRRTCQQLPAAAWSSAPSLSVHHRAWWCCQGRLVWAARC
jgi:hypothetical protein